MTKYKHIFFDLDRTLWDFDKNSIETFHNIYLKYHLKEKGVNDFEEIFKKYQEINHGLWEKYRNGLIEKDFLNIERFYLTLKYYGIDDKKLSVKIANDYVKISPIKTHLFPNSIEILDYLKAKGYTLHIITNGFPEVQYVKMRNAKLSNYFQEIIISEEVGFKKPAIDIFKIALSKAHAKTEESLMVGDDQEVDIQGAKNADIKGVWMNYDNTPLTTEPAYICENLLALKEIL